MILFWWRLSVVLSMVLTNHRRRTTQSSHLCLRWHEQSDRNTWDSTRMNATVCYWLAVLILPAGDFGSSSCFISIRSFDYTLLIGSYCLSSSHGRSNCLARVHLAYHSLWRGTVHGKFPFGRRLSAFSSDSKGCWTSINWLKYAGPCRFFYRAWILRKLSSRRWK